jgi:hypothetical protein
MPHLAGMIGIRLELPYPISFDGSLKRFTAAPCWSTKARWATTRESTWFRDVVWITGPASQRSASPVLTSKSPSDNSVLIVQVLHPSAETVSTPPVAPGPRVDPGPDDPPESVSKREPRANRGRARRCNRERKLHDATVHPDGKAQPVE